MNFQSLTVETNFGCSGITDYGRTTQMTQNLVSSIVMPDSTSYSITYEPTVSPNHAGAKTGRILSITLPTGGTISYDYGNTPQHNSINCSDGSAASLTRATPDSGTVTPWVYTRATGPPASTTIQDPQGNQTVMNFSGIYETQRQAYQGTSGSGTLLETVTTCYNGNTSNCPTASVGLPITQRNVQTSFNGGSSAQVVQLYDGTYTLPYETDEYDFGGSSPKRKTIVSYNYNTSCGVTNPHVVNLPCTVKVEDTSGAVKAETDNTYDANGNLVTESHVNTGGTPSSISRLFTYSSGVLQTSTDFNHNQTSYTNTGCNNSFPTTVTLPSPFSFQSTVGYDATCAGAVVTSATDINGQATQINYSDPAFWRVSEVDYADGGKTTYSYTDTPNAFSVQTSVLVASGVNHQLTQSLDGLGRIIHSQDSSAGTTVDTTYDSLGRVYSVSNPHGTTGSPSDGITYYSYDALGRMTGITYPDTNAASVSYAYVSGSGLCATATDPAGKARESCVDGLGRTTSVVEDARTGGLNYSTTYSYDVLNNLFGVSQGSQTRTYVYDMLSRLTAAVTPEAAGCATTFGYDADGNVTSRLAPKENQTSCSTRVTTTLAYDNLSRLTSKSYNDSVTPTASFSYDETSATIGTWTSPALAYTNGRLTHTTAMNGSTLLAATVNSYDRVGRPAAYYQCTGPDCGSLQAASYSYDLAGEPTGYYPPGMPFQLSLTYDSAQRLTSVTQNTGSWIDSARPATLANFPAYTPFGAVDTLTDGCVGTNCTPYQEKYNYNSRLQPTMIQVGTSTSLNSVACDVYFYYTGFTNPSSCPSTAPTSGTGNNGNPMGWYHWDGDGGGSGVNNTTGYTYDSLNRLTQATMASHYTQNYNYDRYGNMVCSGNYCNVTVAFDSATNHITTTGFTYDAAGNLTKDGTGLGTHTFQWDAEGRMVSVDGQAGQACQTGSPNCFTYNALGQRVKKHVASPASDTYYYYDASGNLAMTKGASQVKEYLLPGNFGKYYWTGSAWETDYTHKNLVGSTQVVTRADGTYAQAQNFYSFGGVRWSAGGTQDVRYASMQERDLETQGWQDPLDPTWFRTYTSGLGRWLSPDPLAGSILNPQSLNRYAYALDNPTRFIDPGGLCPEPPAGYILMSSTPCTYRPKHTCTTMDCADQYYGGSIFNGDVTVEEGICSVAGVIGFCNEGALASFRSPTGADEFDIIAPPINVGSEEKPQWIDPGAGLYWAAEPGSAVTNSSGRTSTSTGMLGFSDLYWSTITSAKDPHPDSPMALPSAAAATLKEGNARTLNLIETTGAIAYLSVPQYSASSASTVGTLAWLPSVPVVNWPSLPSFTGQ